MGIIDKLNEKAMGGASKLIKNKVKKIIGKLIKEKRLIYLPNGKVIYYNKQNVRRDISLDEMATILFEVGGRDNLLQVGVTPDVVKNMLVEAKGK